MAKNTRGSGLKDNRIIIGAIVIVAALVFTGVLVMAQKVFQTETYYVLNQDVPTRTLVTTEMLEPVVTSEGTSPQAALGFEEVQSGNIYTQYPLVAGDLLTMSNVGGLEDISVGVPDEWVITNFSVNADNAVGGRITRGTYFDMLVVDESGNSFYPFVNVLALDTTVDMSGASSAEAIDGEEAQAGQTSQYYVGMSPEDAAKLESVVNRYPEIRLVLSPRQNEYEKPQLAQYAGAFNYNAEADGAIWPGESPAGERTDYTFTDIERDNFGRPVEQIENCSVGNAKVSGESCEADTNDNTTDSSTTTTEDKEATEGAE